MKVRPKTTVVYWISSFDGKMKVDIDCHPQQKWDALIFDDRKEVRLTRQNLTVYVTMEDFKEHWVTVEEKKNKDVQGQLTVYDFPELLPESEVAENE